MKTLIGVAALVLALAIANPSPAADEKSETADAVKLQRLLDDICQRLRTDGGIADRRFPFVVYAEKVDGHTCHRVQFMHYDESGKKFDVIGRAEVVELRVDADRKGLLATAKNVQLKHGKYDSIESAEQEWPLEVNKEFDGRSAKMPNRDELPLSKEDLKFLAEGLPKEEPKYVTLLKQAFGSDGAELGHMKMKVYLPRFNVVFAVDQIEKLSDGRLRYRNLSVAQFRKQDGIDLLQATLKDTEAIVTGLDPFGRGSTGETLVFECLDGTRLTIPRQK